MQFLFLCFFMLGISRTFKRDDFNIYEAQQICIKKMLSYIDHEKVYPNFLLLYGTDSIYVFQIK